MGYGDDLNLYLYVGNDALNLVDPTGRQEFSIQRMARDLHRAILGPAPEQSARAAELVVEGIQRDAEVPAAAASSVMNSPQGVVATTLIPGPLDDLVRVGLGGRAATSSLDDLSRAAGAMDRNGLTLAGRALQKHGDRPGSAFPQIRGRAADFNQAGQEIVDEIITSPGATAAPNRFGGVDIVAPDGRGVRYDGDAEMVGFLEP